MVSPSDNSNNNSDNSDNSSDTVTAAATIIELHDAVSARQLCNSMTNHQCHRPPSALLRHTCSANTISILLISSLRCLPA